MTLSLSLSLPLSSSQLSSRLHYASCPLGVMESELPSWILTLEQALTDIVVRSLVIDGVL